MRDNPDVLALPARRAIFDHIREVPGAHLRGIERELTMPFGQVLYHLDYLERHGLIVTRKDGGFKRYFVTNLVGRQEKGYIAAFRHEVPRKVGVLLLLDPGMTHRQLAAHLPVTGSTLSFHLAKMTEAGILARETVAGEHRHHIVDELTAARALVYYRESYRDPLVDRFAEAWITMNHRPVEERLRAAESDRDLAQRIRGVTGSPRVAAESA